MDLQPGHFASFFAGVHGHPPFPWQQRLVDQLATSDEWPEVLNLPTGTGKTAALDIALFHLALRADQPQRAALRICLVVDRRLVVDDAYSRAERLSDVLADPDGLSDPEHRRVVAEVAARLGTLAEEPARPLVAQRLRGGAPLEHEWARTPTQPVVLCSTVDQVGSRLLFRGYGISARMRPIHAGLLGCNTLVLVDEAHLAMPFLQTLAAIRSLGQAGIKVALLSATPGNQSDKQLTLSDRDRENPLLKRRLTASKRATLLKAPSRKPAAEFFADRAKGVMSGLIDEGVEVPAVGVVVNRVQLARDVFDGLAALDLDARLVLLIGRCRSIERDRVVQEELSPFRTGDRSRSDARPLFVVATQCLEVGVDLDLDGLVTQIAPFDALRQRFGRLNRDGRDILAQADIIALPQDLAKARPDPIYGDRARETWLAINEVATNKTMDFGIEAIDSAIPLAQAETLASPRADAPVLMPPYIDLWASTEPIPESDPDVGLFLHGKEPRSPDVSLVWRADISERDIREHGDQLAGIMALVPPRSTESVAVPMWAARAFLEGRREGYEEVADVADGREEAANEYRRSETVAFRWAGMGDPRTGSIRSGEIRPGDLLVIPSERGGCDRFGWNPMSRSPVRDIADDAAAPYAHTRFAVRVSRDIVHDDADWTRVVNAIARDQDTNDPRVLVDRVLQALPAQSSDGAPPADPRRDFRRDLRLLRDAPGRLELHRYGDQMHSSGGVVLVAKRGLGQPEPKAHPMSVPSTEDDAHSSHAAGQVGLDDHSRQVETRARTTVEKVGLGDDVGHDVALAAYLHDAGKADRRFQVMLAGGDEWNMPEREPMAKSARWSEGAWKRAGLPHGWRHEAQSVRMACVHPRLAKAHDKELVLWLIGTHHGLGRPFFSFVDDDADPDLLPCLEVESWAPMDAGPHTLAFEHLGKSWPAIFESLKQRYGVWGLAHLEAILRLADHRASEAPES